LFDVPVRSRLIVVSFLDRVERLLSESRDSFFDLNGVHMSPPRVHEVRSPVDISFEQPTISGFVIGKSLGLIISKSFLPDCRASIQYQIRRRADTPLRRKGGSVAETIAATGANLRS
jgi:hypothetical protein